VHWFVDEYRLIVAVGTGVEIGPGDGRGVQVIAHRGRIDALFVELVDYADRPEPAQTAAQVLVVAGGEQPSAALAEPADRCGFGIGEAVPDVDGQQPQLVVAQLVDMTQDRVVAVAAGAVARDHVVAGRPQFFGQ